MSKAYLGIDPGLRGAFSLLDASGNIIGYETMPVIGSNKKEVDIQKVHKIFKNLKSHFPGVTAFLEQQIGMPKQNSASTFTTGMGYGYLKMALMVHEIPHTIQVAKAWQKEMFKGTSSKLKPKDRALIVGQRLFPSESFLATKRSTVPHDGIVDSLLMAKFLYQTDRG